ncbi:hypothetical protein QMA56_02020 [Leuconostoc falkenbergense]|nr:hypothetical protein [Leuconostoc falkenbergense]MDI6666480.1 hypothetical protein [Leuconostoc falkenbergense]
MAKIVNREETQTTPIDDLFILPNEKEDDVARTAALGRDSEIETHK